MIYFFSFTKSITWIINKPIVISQNTLTWIRWTSFSVYFFYSSITSALQPPHLTSRRTKIAFSPMWANLKAWRFNINNEKSNPCGSRGRSGGRDVALLTKSPILYTPSTLAGKHESQFSPISLSHSMELLLSLFLECQIVKKILTVTHNFREIGKGESAADALRMMRIFLLEISNSIKESVLFKLKIIFNELSKEMTILINFHLF